MNSDKIITYYKNMGLNISEKQAQQLKMFYELTVEWNEKINLTSITEEEDFLVKHYLDSSLVARHLDMNGIKHIIDVGTGGGFPGIPLKILYPHLKVTLLDSLNKRINYLRLVCETLELTDVECLHGRAEDIGQNLKYREQFDCCVSRAVSDLSVLSEYCVPFIRVGGQFIAYKALESDEEISKAQNAIEILGGKVERIIKDAIPNTSIERKLVFISKIRKTNKKYPRKSGTPTKSPL